MGQIISGTNESKPDVHEMQEKIKKIFDKKHTNIPYKQIDTLPTIYENKETQIKALSLQEKQAKSFIDGIIREGFDGKVSTSDAKKPGDNAVGDKSTQATGAAISAITKNSLYDKYISQPLVPITKAWDFTMNHIASWAKIDVKNIKLERCHTVYANSLRKKMVNAFKRIKQNTDEIVKLNNSLTQIEKIASAFKNNKMFKGIINIAISTIKRKKNELEKENEKLQTDISKLQNTYNSYLKEPTLIIEPRLSKLSEVLSNLTKASCPPIPTYDNFENPEVISNVLPSSTISVDQAIAENQKLISNFFIELFLLILSYLITYNFYYFIFIYEWEESHTFYDPTDGFLIGGRFEDIIDNWLMVDIRYPMHFMSYYFRWLFPKVFKLIRVFPYKRVCFLIILLKVMMMVFTQGTNTLTSIKTFLGGSPNGIIFALAICSAIAGLADFSWAVPNMIGWYKFFLAPILGCIKGIIRLIIAAVGSFISQIMVYAFFFYTTSGFGLLWESNFVGIMDTIKEIDNHLEGKDSSGKIIEDDSNYCENEGNAFWKLVDDCITGQKGWLGFNFTRWNVFKHLFIYLLFLYFIVKIIFFASNFYGQTGMSIIIIIISTVMFVFFYIIKNLYPDNIEPNDVKINTEDGFDNSMQGKKEAFKDALTSIGKKVGSVVSTVTGMVTLYTPFIAALDALDKSPNFQGFVQGLEKAASALNINNMEIRNAFDKFLKKDEPFSTNNNNNLLGNIYNNENNEQTKELKEAFETKLAKFIVENSSTSIQPINEITDKFKRKFTDVEERNTINEKKQKLKKTFVENIVNAILNNKNYYTNGSIPENMSETKQTLSENMYDILVNNLNKKIVDENNAKKEKKLQKNYDSIDNFITTNQDKNEGMNKLFINVQNKKEIQRVRTEAEKNRKEQAQVPESTTNPVSNVNESR